MFTVMKLPGLFWSIFFFFLQALENTFRLKEVEKKGKAVHFYFDKVSWNVLPTITFCRGTHFGTVHTMG